MKSRNVCWKYDEKHIDDIVKLFRDKWENDKIGGKNSRSKL